MCQHPCCVWNVLGVAKPVFLTDFFFFFFVAVPLFRIDLVFVVVMATLSLRLHSAFVLVFISAEAWTSVASRTPPHSLSLSLFYPTVTFIAKHNNVQRQQQQNLHNYPQRLGVRAEVRKKTVWGTQNNGERLRRGSGERRVWRYRSQPEVRAAIDFCGPIDWHVVPHLSRPAGPAPPCPATRHLRSWLTTSGVSALPAGWEKIVWIEVCRGKGGG